MCTDLESEDVGTSQAQMLTGVLGIQGQVCYWERNEDLGHGVQSGLRSSELGLVEWV